MEFLLPPNILAGNIARIIRFTPDKWSQGSWLITADDNIKEYNCDGNGLIPISILHMPENSCGTTACVAGHAAIIAAPSVYKYNYARDSLVLPSDEEVYIEEYSRKALGITNYQSNWLFQSDRTKEQVLWALDKIAYGEEWNGCCCPYQDN